jgi:hypothetical protein
MDLRFDRMARSLSTALVALLLGGCSLTIATPLTEEIRP